MQNLKKIILILIGIIFVSCESNTNYERNLATAKKLFAKMGEENINAQLALVSKDIKFYSTIYDASNPLGFEAYKSLTKSYHDNFEDIKYNAQAWLPGVDTLSLKPDGSVRTYGTWTGKNSITGKKINLKGYWYFNFDDEGKIESHGEFFDHGGMMKALSSNISLSSTAQAIKNYKINFKWQKGFEDWSKVPTTPDYHMIAPGLRLEAKGADEINSIIFGFVTEAQLVQELVNITEHGPYVTCYLKLTTKEGEKFDGVEVFKLDEKGRVTNIWAL